MECRLQLRVWCQGCAMPMSLRRSVAPPPACPALTFASPTTRMGPPRRNAPHSVSLSPISLPIPLLPRDVLRGSICDSVGTHAPDLTRTRRPDGESGCGRAQHKLPCQRPADLSPDPRSLGRTDCSHEPSRPAIKNARLTVSSSEPSIFSVDLNKPHTLGQVPEAPGSSTFVQAPILPTIPLEA